MTTPSHDPRDLVNRRAEIRVRPAHSTSPHDQPLAQGRVIAYYLGPTYIIVDAKGARSTWSADLPIDVVRPSQEPPDRSYMTLNTKYGTFVYQRLGDYYQNVSEAYVSGCTYTELCARGTVTHLVPQPAPSSTSGDIGTVSSVPASADEPEIPDNPYPPGDARGWAKFADCPSHLCALQRKHWDSCPANNNGVLEGGV